MPSLFPTRVGALIGRHFFEFQPSASSSRRFLDIFRKLLACFEVHALLHMRARGDIYLEPTSDLRGLWEEIVQEVLDAVMVSLLVSRESDVYFVVAEVQIFDELQI